MTATIWRRLALGLTWLLALVALGCAGDEDADDATNPADDDDDNDDNDNNDDNNDNDDNDNNDDNNDNDDNDDDNNDDNNDNDDDTSPPPLPPPTYGWILMDPDRDHVSWVLNQAADFAIDHVQLSHNLIMEIDVINDDEARAALLQDIAQEAHGLGLEVWVWSHEFSNESYSICFDPEDDIWARRQDQYRDALTRIPEIDGVVLMFGSADVEPWYALCLCEWCREQQPNFLLSLLYPPFVERARLVYDMVGAVVLDEFGKKLRFRTFMHQPLELLWLGQSLREGADPRLMVMTKDVPQDWQPYYPHDPLIGDVGYRHQIVEMDLGNEYWGRSEILNSQVDYIYYRYSYDRAAGARGAAGRIERGGDHAFGTPNEINLYAFTRLLQDETATPDDVYREWFDQRYGITTDSPAAGTLKEVFRRTFYAMRKMYYTLGQWTLVKGSDVPGEARYPEQLWSRCSAFYDPAWLGPFLSLVWPTERTLLDLWQEGREARELADRNVADLEAIEGAFANPDDYTELHDMLLFHADVAEVWFYLRDTVYRFVYKTLAHPDQDDYLEWNARRLLELADAIEATWGAGAPLANPNDIRAFVDDLREGLPPQGEATEWLQPVLSDVAATPIDDQVQITWTSSEPMTSRVEWAEDLPLYDEQTEEDTNLVTEHVVLIDADAAQRTVFRVGGRTADDLFTLSGDFWFGLDPQ
jgi:hypothetical protein